MTEERLPSLAMVVCVRDEEEFLADHLPYHRALGVDRGYVILDRCTDRSSEIARSFSWVRVIERDRRPEEKYLPYYLSNSVNAALALAREEGFDWLMPVDADEFASGERIDPGARWQGVGLRHAMDPDPARRASLPRMLSQVGEDTEVVWMRTVEVVPQHLPPAAPFWKNHFVQPRQRPSAFKRDMPNAPNGKLYRRRCWFGHDQGKTLARTTADLRLVTTHRWVRASGPEAGRRDVIRVERAGFHYHFNITSATQWRSKYRRMTEYPDHWPSGKPVRFPKQAWKLATAKMSAEEANEYYRKWISVSPRQLVRPLVIGRVAWDPFVERVLAKAKPRREPSSLETPFRQ